jgi:hypothetical protein
MPPTVPEVGVSATSNCRPPISLPLEPVPVAYMPVVTLFLTVRSPFLMRASSRLMTCSFPTFWTSFSSPEIETEPAACFQLNSAAVSTSGGVMLIVS